MGCMMGVMKLKRASCDVRDLSGDFLPPAPAAVRSSMTKSVTAKNLTLPWRGRVGSCRAKRDPRRGGVIVHPWPISKVFLVIHPTPALRADPPPPGETTSALPPAPRWKESGVRPAPVDSKRFSPPLSREGRKKRHRSFSYVMTLPRAGKGDNRATPSPSNPPNQSKTPGAPSQ
jgi:hypothetical protein